MRKLKYRARLYDSTGYQCNFEDFRTITEAREWAESYGGTAKECEIFRLKDGMIVARHCRSSEGDNTKWYKATA